MSDGIAPPRHPETYLPRLLAAALRGPLPGERAHRHALPENHEPRVAPAGSELSAAAVLLLLHPDPLNGGKVRFPLIYRPDSMQHHAGQIALPGGAMDPEEDAVRCALREASEEVGLPVGSVEVLGQLTPVVIPVSLYRVEAVVAWLDTPPNYRPQESEVLKILFGDPDQLAREGPGEFVERVRLGVMMRFPAYRIEGERVWGATALILSEFLSIWREIRRAVA